MPSVGSQTERGVRAHSLLNTPKFSLKSIANQETTNLRQPLPASRHRAACNPTAIWSAVVLPALQTHALLANFILHYDS